MSTETLVGGIIGGVAGFLYGGPVGAVYGFAIGAGIGAYASMPDLPGIKGPRLNDLTIQTSSYGNRIPRIYSTIGIPGNVIWLERNSLKEVARKEKTGGKGGGQSQTVTTYEYYATFAVALCEGPIDGIRRIWCSDKLAYDAGSYDLATVIASNLSAGLAHKNWTFAGRRFQIYTGSDDQLPDPRMEADLGVGNCPAYRGLAYVVFYDFPLKDFGNTLQGAQFKFEVMKNATAEPYLIESVSDTVPNYTNNPAYNATPGFVSTESVIFYMPIGAVGNIGFDAIRYSMGNNKSKKRYTGPASTNGTPCWVADEIITFFNDDEIFNDANWNSDLQTGDHVQIRESRYVGIYDANDLIFYKDEKNTFRLFKAFAYITDTSCKFAALGYDDDFYAVGNNVIRHYTVNNAEITLDYSDTVSLVIGSTPRGRAWVDSGYLWISDGAEPTCKIYRFHLEDRTLEHYCSVTPNNAALMMVSGDIAVFANSVISGSNTTLNVKWYNLASVSGTSQTLADVVEAEITRSGIIESSDIDTSLLSGDVGGYRISDGSIGSSIQQLRTVYRFDLIQSGYGLKAVPRGGSSVATIDSGELGAGEKAGVELTQDREMDTQLPAWTIVKYIDPDREYLVNQQQADRGITDSVSRMEIEFAFALTAAEAAQSAEILQSIAWLERKKYDLKLPPTYIDIEPSDVVTVTTDDASLELRIESANYTPAGVIECKAVPNRAAVYSSTLAGSAGNTAPGTINYSGESLFLPLDIPCVDEYYQDEFGFVGVMCGYHAGWSSGTAFRSINNGQSWEAVQGYAGACTVATAIDTLAADDGYVVDSTSELSVRFMTAAPSSITVEDMFLGRNYFAYGIDGRWEIMQAATITLQGDGTYVISDLLRGLRGTEWATGEHEIGDYVVYLGDEDNAFISTVSSLLNVLTLWRGVSGDRALEDEVDVNFTYAGANLKPLMPIWLAGEMSGLDWVITWKRRSRLKSALWNTGTAIPLGEDSESYEIDILDGAAVVRTITATSETCTYTQAQQEADFGAVQSELSVIVYQISADVGRGFGAEAELTLDAGVTSILLHFEGADASTTITDSSTFSRTITAVANAQLDTDYYQIGSASLLLDGTGDYLTTAGSTDFRYSNSGFCVEGFVRRAATKLQCIATNRGGLGALSVGWALFIQADNTVTMIAYNTSSGAVYMQATSSGTIALTTWTHIAASYDGTTLRIFIDGTLDGSSTTKTGTLSSSTYSLTVGRDPGNTGRDFNGHIDEFRIVVGSPVYVSNFTPPTTPLE